MTSFSIVVPTVGRPSLDALLAALNGSEGPRAERIVVVDDRADPSTPLAIDAPGWASDAVEVRTSGGRGPAAARNVGWQACRTPWVVFLDDDVLVTEHWLRDLAADLHAAGPEVGGSQGRITVPRARHRRPTDWERGTAGLETARWITADLAYRRTVLAGLRGFDERFPRAFREDADFALRAIARGWRLVDGTRRTMHPVRPAPWNASIRQQRGNADDALMRRLHGADWHRRADAHPGRFRRHVAVTVAAAASVLAGARGRRAAALIAATGWLAGTAEFAWARIAPGPRDRVELARMAVTSAAIPPLAVWHRLRGEWQHRAAAPWSPPVEAVLFDRDGTLVHDVAYNGRPELVQPVDQARDVLDRLRAVGVRVGVVSNQSGVARGLISEADVKAVNDRVEELLGPFGTWQYCPHDDRDGCACRKPAPGMVLAAAEALGVPVERCVLVGDTTADLGAGAAAGVAASFLVPNAVTRADEVAAAALVLPDLTAVTDALLGPARTTVGARP